MLEYSEENEKYPTSHTWKNHSSKSRVRDYQLIKLYKPLQNVYISFIGYKFGRSKFP